MRRKAIAYEWSAFLRSDDMQKDIDSEEYPPLFELDVIWDVCLCLAIQLKRKLQVSSAMTMRKLYS